MTENDVERLQQEITACRACPRLVVHREEIARVKRRAYQDQTYWGRPVPGFGDPRARLLILGLAPGAHGANRTGRMFTGDRSGDFLYRALYETGFASQPESRDRGDGLRLNDCYISAPVRCVPPDNRPLPDEIRQCSAYLAREINLLKRIAVVVTLGRIGFDAYRGLQGIGALPFGHGFVHRLNPVLIASYHPSQQNTQTGRLTPEMLRHVFETARSFLGGETRLEPGDSVES